MKHWNTNVNHMRKKSDTPSLKPQRSKDSSSFSSVSDVGHNKVTEPGEARGLPFLSKAAVRNHQVNQHPPHPAIMVFSCIPHGFSLNLKAFGFLVLSSVLSCADESRHAAKSTKRCLDHNWSSTSRERRRQRTCGQQLLRPTAAFLKAKLKYVKSHRKMQIETYHIHHRKGVEIK